MSRFERKIWFERLCQLRDGYGTADHTPIMSITEAIEYAEQLLLEGAGEGEASGSVAERPTTPD